jgi:hypothetical protein
VSDPVGVFVDEGLAFDRRHPELDETRRAWGALAWGLMRALAACPDCPGVFRQPIDGDWNRLLCPRCGGLWTRDV